jgi:hypothetical protein
MFSCYIWSQLRAQNVVIFLDVAIKSGAFPLRKHVSITTSQHVNISTVLGGYPSFTNHTGCIPGENRHWVMTIEIGNPMEILHLFWQTSIMLVTKIVFLYPFHIQIL